MRNYSLIFMSLVCCSVYAGSEAKEFEAKGLRGVSVNNTSGNIVISSSDAAKATVTATKNKFSAQCKMTIDRSGNQLLIKVEKRSGLFSIEECDVDFQINIPKSINLDLAVGSGDITIKGIQGNLDFKVGSGDITADGLFKNINGKSGSGKIALKGLTGGGELKTGSGDIDLTYSVSSLKGDLDLKTGSGDATIFFPKGTKVKVSHKAGSGELNNEVGDYPQAAFRVSMKAGSGDLKLKSY